MHELYSQLEVARAARTSPSYLNSLIRDGVIPGPRVQLGLRWYYDQANRDQVVARFEARRQEKIDLLVKKQTGEKS